MDQLPASHALKRGALAWHSKSRPFGSRIKKGLFGWVEARLQDSDVRGLLSDQVLSESDE